jgi:hypothetical protein
LNDVGLDAHVALEARFSALGFHGAIMGSVREKTRKRIA